MRTPVRIDCATMRNKLLMLMRLSMGILKFEDEIIDGEDFKFDWLEHEL